MVERLDGFPGMVVARALEYAGLQQTSLKEGSHPDTGADCLYLEATIQQYSGFLAALAVQYRTAEGTAAVTDHVQIEHDSKGDTRFWIPGVQVHAARIPRTRQVA